MCSGCTLAGAALLYLGLCLEPALEVCVAAAMEREYVSAWSKGMRERGRGGDLREVCIILSQVWEGPRALSS